MNILVAPNSFKECADSVSISEIINSVLLRQSGFNIKLKPLSDGGDGFLSSYKYMSKIKSITYLIKDNYRDKLNEYMVLLDENSNAILIESAELFGLKVIPENELNPLNINSEGLGKLLLMINEDILNKKIDVKEVFLGVGGTATIDFGVGVCSQLGLELYDKLGNELAPIPKNFMEVVSYSFRKKELAFKIKCIVDVGTELLGSPGAIEIFGKQKGASEEDLVLIKMGIEKVIDIFSKDRNFINKSKLNGAGGGLAAGLNLFFDAEIISAEYFITHYLMHDLDIDKIDAVITGEGSLDFQSFEGKGVGVILKMFRDKNIPIFIICGSANLPETMKLTENVFVISLTSFFKDKKESIDNFRSGLVKATELVINQLIK
ncbi:MAG: glycerate kinase [Ignavibacteriaceae bacterium]